MNLIFSIIIIILIVLIYYRYYTKIEKTIQINQIFLENFTPNLLYEKYPLLIYDRIQDPDELTKTIFKYSYLFKTKKKTKKSKTTAKYTLVYSSYDSVLDITQSDNYISINLAANQVVILPYGWKYSCDEDLNVIMLQDIFSKIFCH